MKFAYRIKERLKSLPITPGVYALKGNKNILYIGKAGNLRNRVRTHFQQPTWRDALFLKQIDLIGHIETPSEIDALLLEAELIKKHNPKYNVIWKDGKNYTFVAITKENVPRVLILHQKDKEATYIGPFVDAKALKRTVRMLRRIFPYTASKTHPKIPCQYCHLGLCPGQNPDIAQYKKNLRKLVLVLKGEKRSVLRQLQKEMDGFAKKQEYELASVRKNQMEDLQTVFSHAHIFNAHPLKTKQVNWAKLQKELKKLTKQKRSISRIETYDISNIQGKLATGSMVVFEKGKPAKQEYRKFKIRIAGKPNDTAMIKEILERRFKHTEWQYPDIILIDGGKPQLTAAKKAREEFTRAKNIPILAIAKRFNELFIEDKKESVLLSALSGNVSNLILFMRDEAHRFAITYHRKLRAVDLLSKKGRIL